MPVARGRVLRNASIGVGFGESAVVAATACRNPRNSSAVPTGNPLYECATISASLPPGR